MDLTNIRSILPARQSFEVFSVLSTHAGQPFIGIDLYQIPPGVIADVFRVVINLRDIGIDLIFGVRTDAGVCCNAEIVWYGRLRINYGNPGAFCDVLRLFQCTAPW